MTASGGHKSLMSQWRFLLWLGIAMAFGAGGVAIPFVNAHVVQTVEGLSLFEPARATGQLETAAAGLRAAAALYQADPTPGREHDLRRAFKDFAAGAARIATGEFDAFVRSAPERQAEAEAIAAAVQQLAPIVETPDVKDVSDAAEKIFEALETPIAQLERQTLEEASVRTTAQFAAFEQAQRYQMLLAIGLLVSGCGMFTLALRQNGAVQRLLGIQARLSGRFEYLAAHDPLTGLPNRAAFEAQMRGAFERRHARYGRLALLMLDLDKFKTVNDVLGHGAGDRLLISTAERLKAIVDDYPSTFAARLGGDEFAVLVEGVDAAETAKKVSEDILFRIGEPHQVGPLSLTSQASIGLALAPDHAAGPEEFVAAGDAALYRAKARGRGVCVVYEAVEGEAHLNRSDLDSRIAAAIAGDQIEPLFRPQINLATGEIAAVEASFGQYRQGEVVPVDEWRSAAESSGHIVMMELTLLAKACARAVDLPAGVKIAVPLSTAHSLCTGGAWAVLAVISSAGADPQRIEFEIPETMLSANAKRAGDFLRVLREAGVSLALEGFGGRGSNLTHVQSVVFDKVKIDRELIVQASSDAKAQRILRSITDLGRSLGYSSVACGLNEETLAGVAKRMGCALGGGRIYGDPARFGDMQRRFAAERLRKPLTSAVA